MKTKHIEPAKGKKFKHPVKLTLTIEAALWSAPEADQHFATFTYQDCSSQVSLGDKEVGEVIAGIGCNVMLRDAESHYSYCLGPKDLWDAFQKAFKEQQ